MRVVVVGAGAVGLLYAGLLAGVGGNDVVVLSRRTRKDASPQRTIEISGIPEIASPVEVAASGLEGLELGEIASDLVLSCVKAFDIEKTTRLVDPLLSTDSAMILLQNGIDLVSDARRGSTKGDIIQAATTFAVRLGEGSSQVICSRLGETWLPRHMQRFDEILSTFEVAGLRPRPIDSATTVAWRKAAIATGGLVGLVVNAGIDAVVAEPSLRHLAKTCSKEIAEIANSTGCDLNWEELDALQDSIWRRNMGGGISSLVQDQRAGRSTELDHRFGRILTKATEQGIDAPTLRVLLTLASARLKLG